MGCNPNKRYQIGITELYLFIYLTFINSLDTYISYFHKFPGHVYCRAITHIFMPLTKIYMSQTLENHKPSKNCT